MIKKSLVVLAVIVALTAGVLAAPEKPAKSQTVGEFAVKVNAALGKVSADQRAAAESLKARGVDLGKDLSAVLTEERAASILRDLGVRVAPGDSTSELSAARADQLIIAAALSPIPTGATIQSFNCTPPAADPQCECLSEKNRGQCEICCKLTFGCDPNGQCDFASRCAKFCKSILPSGKSPSEPQ